MKQSHPIAITSLFTSRPFTQSEVVIVYAVLLIIEVGSILASHCRHDILHAQSHIGHIQWPRVRLDLLLHTLFPSPDIGRGCGLLLLDSHKNRGHSVDSGEGRGTWEESGWSPKYCPRLLVKYSGILLAFENVTCLDLLESLRPVRISGLAHKDILCFKTL